MKSYQYPLIHNLIYINIYIFISYFGLWLYLLHFYKYCHVIAWMSKVVRYTGLTSHVSHAFHVDVCITIIFLFDRNDCSARCILHCFKATNLRTPPSSQVILWLITSYTISGVDICINLSCNEIKLRCLGPCFCTYVRINWTNQSCGHECCLMTSHIYIYIYI